MHKEVERIQKEIGRENTCQNIFYKKIIFSKNQSSIQPNGLEKSKLRN